MGLARLLVVNGYIEGTDIPAGAAADACRRVDDHRPGRSSFDGFSGTVDQALSDFAVPAMLKGNQQACIGELNSPTSLRQGRR
jgi:hypothetical protein